MSKFGGILFTPLRYTAEVCYAAGTLKVRVSLWYQQNGPPPTPQPLHQPLFICQHIANAHLSQLTHTVSDRARFDYRSHWSPLWVEISTTKLFFHLLDLTVLNIRILLSSCRAKHITHRDFRLLLVRNLIERSWKKSRSPHPQFCWKKILCDSRAPKTNTGQRNCPSNVAAVCFHLSARARAQCISAPDVKSACAWCLVSRNITPE